MSAVANQRNWEFYRESLRTLEEKRENRNRLFAQIFTASSGVIAVILTIGDFSGGIVTLILSIFSIIHCIVWRKSIGELNALIWQKYEVIFKLEENLDIKLCTDEKALKRKYDKTTSVGSGELACLLCFLLIFTEITLSLLKIFNVI